MKIQKNLFQKFSTFIHFSISGNLKIEINLIKFTQLKIII